MRRKRRKSWGLLALALLLVLAGCGGGSGNDGGNGGNTENGGNAANAGGAADGSDKPLQKVRVVLDWSPNTNHTGLYVARDKGFFAEQGLDVEIIQPGEAGADQMVASGEVEFGVSYQEAVTLARTNGVPIVSIAAVIQHNTSGFASPAEKNIKTPKDFEGKKYGGWGSPVEEAVIDSIMQEDGGDVSKVVFVNVGDTDFFTAVKRDVDFFWIFYGWTGIEAELRGEELNMIYLTDYSEKLDYYTPVLATSEKLIEEKPDLVKAFVAGAAAGYKFAIESPEEAADILIAAEPDLNAELVKASQKWLSAKYQDDAPRWGEQKLEVWKNYAEWMAEHGVMEGEFDPEAAFTNEFLPE
ncbi:MAG: ABC transporter substrate-binding protein [Thermobacillus sp.]|uniref:ABC transporter substrate-binding protein n=1 Tax=Thermobacillus sp. TaxID=2108467 RepID=UPI000E383D57|nr:ABC transporter substrate-binding protein [Thermobacillus sp.]REK53922.1 MAG: ABC transporter substrate-binding protein [Thermobacillus sp.]